MVLDWLAGKVEVDALIARGQYAKAIERLQAELAKGSRDPRLRLQLADALVQERRSLDAVPLYMDLADEYASDGFAAKAIALLKKVQRLDPGRGDVEKRLATLIKGKERPRGAWTPREGAAGAGYEPAGAVFSADHFTTSGAADPDRARIDAARGASWVPSTHEEPVQEIAIPAVPPPAPRAGEIVASPLFSGFSQDELEAVIRGLRLLSFEPGDIILTEGEAGDSLFVLTSGTLKTFLRDARGKGQLFVRRLVEGDFFGEISILSGKPRSATVTAATACELLELDRATLDEIARSHPHVREVLEEFYVSRATTQDEEVRKHNP
jgi:hypothetical protein